MQINKLTKRHSTKGERRFMEACKKLHIPFQAKVMIQGREIDFLIGNYAIEIDSHQQDPEKNKMLIAQGLNPIHMSNTSPFEEWLTKIKWQGTTISPERIYSLRRLQR